MRTKFPPNWSMESILVIALAVAVIVVIFAQADPADRTRFTVEQPERSELVRQLRPAFAGGDETVLGR